MHPSMTRQADMDKENVPGAEIREPTARVTRARAKALGVSIGLPPLHPQAKQQSNQALQPNSKTKRGSDYKSSFNVGSSFQSKRRAAFKDVTNMSSTDLNIKMIGTAKKKDMVAPAAFVDQQVRKRKAKPIEDVTKQSIKELRGITAQLKLANNIETKRSICSNPKAGPLILGTSTSNNDFGSGSSLPKGEKLKLSNKVEAVDDPVIHDIDSKYKDPQMCSLYAAELYNNLRATELKWRPSVDYMKTMQRDITQEMRGILIDWIVEVCQEYRLASETLYLTVALIDRYLSKMYIEKQRLQLLGITCMLVASKYEEIAARPIEDFCFITDGTYTKKEVLHMEGQVLETLNFHLSVPTVKKFLRRFILAAQSSYKFLPSLIAASAVFLAKWTLDQIEHPWNPTLEYYTNYKASDLKAVVLAMQDMQLNKASTLHAIRQKYSQKQFNGVATLTSLKPVTSFS